MDISDDIFISIILVMHMLKYVNTDIVFQEIPNETTLAINISNCPCHCKGCHSAYLAEDIGEYLIDYPKNIYSDDFSIYNIDELIEKNEGITCVGLMGGDSDPLLINILASYIKLKYPDLLIAWYSGRQELAKEIELENFNFIKLGPYIEELGGLKSPATNQRLYEYNPLYSDYTIGPSWRDITSTFWK